MFYSGFFDTCSCGIHNRFSGIPAPAVPTRPTDRPVGRVNHGRSFGDRARPLWGGVLGRTCCGGERRLGTLRRRPASKRAIRTKTATGIGGTLSAATCARRHCTGGAHRMASPTLSSVCTVIEISGACSDPCSNAGSLCCPCSLGHSLQHTSPVAARMQCQQQRWQVALATLGWAMSGQLGEGDHVWQRVATLDWAMGGQCVGNRWATG